MNQYLEKRGTSLMTIGVCVCSHQKSEHNTDSKSPEQLRCIVNEVLKNSVINGSDIISIHMIKSENEAAIELAFDLLTNYFSSAL